MTASNWYRVENVDEIPSPSLLVYLERVAENITRVIRYAGGAERLRPHVKTHKMAAVIKMHLAAGIRKFKGATIAEIEMVADAGGADVLLAYQPVGPNQARLVRLAELYPSVRFSCVVDDVDVVRSLGALCHRAGVELELLVDIDDGMHRTGIEPARADAVYQAIANTEGVRPGGLHVYDGHVREVDLSARQAEVAEGFGAVDELLSRLKAASLPVPRLVVGGSPSFPVHALRAEVELSPGTYSLWDEGYGSRYPDLEFLPAAVLITRVVSKPGVGRVCLDLGHKAVAADTEQRVVLLDVPDARRVGHSEEHLVIETTRAGELRLGEVLYGIPYHVCPTVALHREAYVVRQGRVVDRWAVTARDRVLTV